MGRVGTFEIGAVGNDVNFSGGVRMKSRVYVMFAVFLLSIVALGGCGTQSSERTSHVAGNESSTIEEGTQIADTHSFEYEIQELSAWGDENQIYGVVYIPQMEAEQMPVVIYAHGYGATHQNGIQYAEKLAERGFVVYCFDFGGGSTGSRSDGSTLEMSVLTEQADLETVIEMVRDLDYVDSEQVFLFGASQGGVVSGITAAENREKLKGLILLYPAFELVETVQNLFPSPEEIPESYRFLWMTVGRRYFEDVQDLDIYDVIGAYDKDVLLIHGDSDSIVPLSSLERALEVYPSAELKIIPGAGHGLEGQDAETATEYMVEYLQRMMQT